MAVANIASTSLPMGSDNGRDGLSSVIDNTKKDQGENKSVFGAMPNSGSFYPRPEIDRRPETDNKSFGSLMAFDGAGPETINGRLDDDGADGSVYTGQSRPIHFFMMVQLFRYASLVPMFKGESPDSRSSGPFRAMAERWNVMIGFLSLIVTKAFTRTAVFHV